MFFLRAVFLALLSFTKSSLLHSLFFTQHHVVHASDSDSDHHVVHASVGALGRLPRKARKKIFDFAGRCWGASELIAKPRLRRGRQIWKQAELDFWASRCYALGLVLTEHRDDYGHIPCGGSIRPRSPADFAIEIRQLEALEAFADMPRNVFRWWILGTPPVRGQLKFRGPPTKEQFRRRRFLQNRSLERTVEAGVLVPRPRKRISLPSHFPGRNGGGTGPKGGAKFHERILDHSRIPFREDDVLGVPQRHPGPKERAYFARAKIALSLGVEVAWEQMPEFFSAFFEDARRLLLPRPGCSCPEKEWDLFVGDVCDLAKKRMGRRGANARIFPNTFCPPRRLPTFSERDERWLANVFLPLVNEGTILTTAQLVGCRTIL